ncbi:hypothetical protein Hanom_Chr00s000023g01616941 [Helianthus anomalus]
MFENELGQIFDGINSSYFMFRHHRNARRVKILVMLLNNHFNQDHIVNSNITCCRR